MGRRVITYMAILIGGYVLVTNSSGARTVTLAFRDFGTGLARTLQGRG